MIRMTRIFALLLSLALVSTPVLAEMTQPRLAVQLWSVKDDIQADFEGTLRALADMGFEGVEFARYFGPYQDDPEGLKAFLDSLGLEAMGAHIGFDNVSEHNFDATVAFYDVLECYNLTIAMDHRAWDPAQVDTMIGDLNRISDQLAAHGMRFGYHNHHQEFADYGEDTFWDHIARNTGAPITMQLDVGNMQRAVKDPETYVRRYPGRTYSTHYKATLPPGTTGKKPFIGQDTINWPSLLKANREVGGTAWLIVEQEEYEDDISQTEAVRISLQGLQAYMQPAKLVPVKSWFRESEARQPLGIQARRIYFDVQDLEYSISWENRNRRGISPDFKDMIQTNFGTALQEQLEAEFRAADYQVVSDPSVADLIGTVQLTDVFINAPERDTITETYVRRAGSATFNLELADRVGWTVLKIRDNRQTREREGAPERAWRGRTQQDFEREMTRWASEAARLLRELEL